MSGVVVEEEEEKEIFFSFSPLSFFSPKLIARLHAQLFLRISTKEERIVFPFTIASENIDYLYLGNVVSYRQVTPLVCM